MGKFLTIEFHISVLGATKLGKSCSPTATYLYFWLFMIAFESHRLENGLLVLAHHDPLSNVAVLNVAYKVGSRDEDPQHTGFAHLFEHLMFGGSVNIPSYDEPLQKAGGENNAYTTPDLTNYYLTLPANNIETGFWLESDRMLGLAFNEQSLEVQRKVVIEEFKQRYLNKPYGNAWHLLREMAYQVHPYRWPTIGKEISHIEQATMEQVKAFFKRYYVPNNAVLVVAGNIKPERAFALAEKWFGPIARGAEIERHIPPEPVQTAPRLKKVSENVPAHAYYKVYHMPGRGDAAYHRTDLLSDILGRGKSSRLQRLLVEERKTFSELSAYVLGSFDPGLLAISGQLAPGVDFDRAEREVQEVITNLQEKGATADELEKVKNQALTSLAFGEVHILTRAMNLAYYALLNDPQEANRQEEKIRAVTLADIGEATHTVLRDSNSSTLYYQALPLLQQQETASVLKN